MIELNSFLCREELNSKTSLSIIENYLYKISYILYSKL